MHFRKSRRIRLLLLMLVTAALTLTGHILPTSCEKHIQLSTIHSHTNSQHLDAFCILNDGSGRQQSSDIDSCSSVLKSVRINDGHFNISYQRCSYCCVGQRDNKTHKKSVFGSDQLERSRRPEIPKSVIGPAKYPSQTQVSLGEIGIKKVFLINLDSRKDRLANVMQLLGYLRFPFTRFPAIDVRSMFNQTDGLNKQTSFFRNFFNRKHNDGQVGAWQSHLQLYFRIVEESQQDDRPVLILEDDIDMEVDTPTLLKRALESLPNDWEIFVLGHALIQCSKTYGTVCRVWQLFCLHAYVIRNSIVASKLIQWSNTAHTQIADHVWLDYIKRGLLIMYASYPNHIVVQSRQIYGTNIGVGPIPEVPLRNSLRRLLNQ